MDGELENANPTILSAAQLPSRRQQKLAAGMKKGPEFRFDHIIHGSDDSDSDSYTEEPIDEPSREVGEPPDAYGRQAGLHPDL